MLEADAGSGGRSPVGERLRAAREATGLSLDDVAARTRVPTRHLDAMEKGAWDRLPGPTYVSGFAKAYADIVGLDRFQVGDDIRAEMGGARAPVHADAYQPADPKRVPPRTLAIGAGVLAVLVAGGVWFMQGDRLDEAQPEYFTTVDAPSAPRAQPAASTPAAPAPPATGPVVLTAREPVWMEIRERGGAVLVSRELRAGERFEVPATAQDPILRTGRPEFIDTTVGGQPAPTLGPAGRTLSDRSLRPEAVLASAQGGPGSVPAANPLVSSPSPPAGVAQDRPQPSAVVGTPAPAPTSQRP